jgi:hypothetical protein
MVRDGKLSDTRASAGMSGNLRRQKSGRCNSFAVEFADDFATAKHSANTEYEYEYEIEDESKEKNSGKTEETKERARGKTAAMVNSYGEYGWVKLTKEKYEKLLAELGEEELIRCIRYVDESAQSTHNKNKWKDWNLVLRKCHRYGWGLNTTFGGRKGNERNERPDPYRGYSSQTGDGGFGESKPRGFLSDNPDSG